LHYQQPGFTACFGRHTGDGSALDAVIRDSEDAQLSGPALFVVKFNLGRLQAQGAGLPQMDRMRFASESRWLCHMVAGKYGKFVVLPEIFLYNRQLTRSS